MYSFSEQLQAVKEKLQNYGGQIKVVHIRNNV